MVGGGGHSKSNRHRCPKKEAPSPRGCMPIRVGGDGEELQRFVVPVEYFNHPLFAGLLREAEEKYGFGQKGAITIPCHVDDFRHIRGLIDRENAAAHGHNLHIYNCFKA